MCFSRVFLEGFEQEANLDLSLPVFKEGEEHGSEPWLWLAVA